MTEGFNPGPPPDIPLNVHFPEDYPLECCKHKDAAFLLTVGSFLLTVELFYLQLPILAVFFLQLELFLLTILAFYLQLELSCLQWESASNKGPYGTVSKGA